MNRPGPDRMHHLKCEARFFDAVKSGHKTAEIRFNDRDFQAGDKLLLYPTDKGEVVMGANESLILNITHVLSGWGLQEGHVMLSFKIEAVRE